MANPQMPQIPGAAVVTDTLDFVKNLWGSMSVPGMGMPGITAPTMSVEELDKKISDLKAVEAWLNLNTSMLRGSIQALEVQRGTIATLKSMGASMAAAITQPGASEKSVFESVPYASAFFQQASPAAPAPKPAPAPAPAAEPAAAAPSDTGSQAAAPLGNPSAWWNLLQDQFKQAVSTAMSPDAASAAAASFGSVSKAKPAASKPAKPAEAGTAAKAKAPLRKAPAKRAAPKAKAPGKA
ncbi:PhaM family polyhydroxyalkanoate granule multifunctional regulatory protein [Janthinobacterium sp. UMAB-56]|uniref:PhaM family polyhydroxyalkanoate granule multifunctional regulatory protein n=1 Tax=Janthinobacterium sp. UMAB-56 TaxID=1365361 RepID=UPI001C58732E|nr:PhaM family polyhydroxyalkanoate granule multifunctional regulatory protein [Janthinobacterium sp. UMAB-56]